MKLSRVSVLLVVSVAVCTPADALHHPRLTVGVKNSASGSSLTGCGTLRVGAKLSWRHLSAGLNASSTGESITFPFPPHTLCSLAQGT
jgi:hypothetical protein